MKALRQKNYKRKDPQKKGIYLGLCHFSLVLFMFIRCRFQIYFFHFIFCSFVLFIHYYLFFVVFEAAFGLMCVFCMLIVDLMVVFQLSLNFAERLPSFN